MLSVTDRAARWRRTPMAGLLNLLYVFLYAPILYVIYASFSQDIVWPFPPAFTSQAYADLVSNSLYSDALINSLIIGLGSRRGRLLRVSGHFDIVDNAHSGRQCLQV